MRGTIEELLAADSARVPENTGTADAFVTSIDHYGQLKEMGLDYGWGTSAFFEWLIEHVHIMSGYSWGASIICCSILLRTGLFYFQAVGSDNMGKMAAMTPVLKGYQEGLERAIATGDAAKERYYKMKQMHIGKEVGAKVGKSLGPPILQAAFGFGAFRCLRGMSTLPAPGMTEGGFFWFHDLTLSDPYYLLPTLTGAIMWVVLKVCPPAHPLGFIEY